MSSSVEFVGGVNQRPLWGMVVALLIAFLWNGSTLAAGAVVKKSRSGICHSAESPYYASVKIFEPFRTLESCLSTGARLPRGMSKPGQKTPSKTVRTSGKYSRDAFGSWADSDSDCQNTRAELLISQSTGPVRFSNNRKCRVVAGRWISMFTGDVIHIAKEVDVDHIVPLAYAWPRGAANWNDQKRELFANDHRNLVVMERGLNRSKGARGPTEWMPPQGKCQYLARFVRILKLYQLQLAPSEFRKVKTMLTRCR